jgi:hypothetical protein
MELKVTYIIDNITFRTVVCWITSKSFNSPWTAYWPRGALFPCLEGMVWVPIAATCPFAEIQEISCWGLLFTDPSDLESYWPTPCFSQLCSLAVVISKEVLLVSNQGSVWSNGLKNAIRRRRSIYDLTVICIAIKETFGWLQRWIFQIKINTCNKMSSESDTGLGLVYVEFKASPSWDLELLSNTWIALPSATTLWSYYKLGTFFQQ